MPSHIAFPRFVVRLIPLHQPIDVFCFRRVRPPCGEILQIFPDRLLGYVAVLIKDIKIFKTKVSQFNFRAVDFKILEPVDSFSLTKNVFGTQEHDIEFLQVVVHLALVQRLAVAHSLIVTSPLGDVHVIFHLHLNIKTTEGHPIRSRFLYKDIVADTLVERAYVNSLFGLGILELVNPNAKHSLKERLCNFLVAKHHCKHEPVRNGELFKRNAFCTHFFILLPKRVGFRK